MRLSEYIKAMKHRKAGTPNTQQMAQSMDDVQPEQGPTTKKKTFNKPMMNIMERSLHPSPYIEPSETLAEPNPVAEDKSLRQHIQNYRKHATRPDMGSYNKRSYV